MNFESLSIIEASIFFIIAAGVVWVCGSRLSRLADNLSVQTGVGRALIGVLMLGGITSLPEIATTVTASLKGNAGMAVSNILGGVSMQVTILAVVDFWLSKKPISTSTSNTNIIIQGVLLILLLALTAVFIVSPSISLYHVGINSIAIFVLFVCGLYFIHKYNSWTWSSYDSNNLDQIQVNLENLQKRFKEVETQTKEGKKERKISVSSFLKQNGLQLIILSVLILVAGYVVVRTSESIAKATGISNSFAGLVLIAITTSLPEISTTISSIKLNRYDMAFSNIFGTNLFDIALIFIADLLLVQGPVFDALDNFAVVAAMLGIVLTSIFLLGITARSKKTIMGLGIDSLIILITYTLGILMLFYLQN